MENNTKDEPYLHVLKPKRIIQSISPENFVLTLTKEEVISLSNIENSNFVAQQILKASQKSGYEPEPFLFMFAKPQPSEKGTLFFLIIKKDKTLIAYDMKNSKKITFKNKIIFHSLKSGRKIQFLLESGLLLKFTLKRKFKDFQNVIEDFFSNKPIPYYQTLYKSANELTFPLQLFPDLQKLLYPCILSPSLDFIMKFVKKEWGNGLLSFFSQIAVIFLLQSHMLPFFFDTLLTEIVQKGGTNDDYFSQSSFCHWFLIMCLRFYGKEFEEQAEKYKKVAIKNKTENIITEGTLIQKIQHFAAFLQTYSLPPNSGYLCSSLFAAMKKTIPEDQCIEKCSKIFIGLLINHITKPRVEKHRLREEVIKSDLHKLFDFENTESLPDEVKQMIPQIKERLLQIFTQKYQYNDIDIEPQFVASANSAVIRFLTALCYYEEEKEKENKKAEKREKSNTQNGEDENQESPKAPHESLDNSKESEYTHLPFKWFLDKAIVEAKKIVESNDFSVLKPIKKEPIVVKPVPKAANKDEEDFNKVFSTPQQKFGGDDTNTTPDLILFGDENQQENEENNATPEIRFNINDSNVPRSSDDENEHLITQPITLSGQDTEHIDEEPPFVFEPGPDKSNDATPEIVQPTFDANEQNNDKQEKPKDKKKKDKNKRSSVEIEFQSEPLSADVVKEKKKKKNKDSENEAHSEPQSMDSVPEKKKKRKNIEPEEVQSQSTDSAPKKKKKSNESSEEPRTDESLSDKKKKRRSLEVEPQTEPKSSDSFPEKKKKKQDQEELQYSDANIEKKKKKKSSASDEIKEPQTSDSMPEKKKKRKNDDIEYSEPLSTDSLPKKKKKSKLSEEEPKSTESFGDSPKKKKKQYVEEYIPAEEPKKKKKNSGYVQEEEPPKKNKKHEIVENENIKPKKKANKEYQEEVPQKKPKKQRDFVAEIPDEKPQKKKKKEEIVVEEKPKSDKKKKKYVEVEEPPPKKKEKKPKIVEEEIPKKKKKK